MPELKRQFGGGAMNKDLDERLVPNGQYRDALNIQVSSSEGSDVGAVQNVLGNRLPYGDSLQGQKGLLGNNPQTVGVFTDTKNEKIYWFVASDSKSVIIEYDQILNDYHPILVDALGVLDFNINFKITGINIIDDLLFWSDNRTEPKKINIKTWRGYNASNASFQHTQINGSSFTEDQITMIKKAPTTEPSIVMSNSLRSGIIETTLMQTSFTDANGEPLPTGPYPTGNSNFTFTSAANFIVGDKIKIKVLDAEEEEEDEEIIISIVEVFPTQTSTFKINIDVMPEDIADDLQNWSAVLVQKKAVFEFKFPQFAYRYKYDDNEYSAIGPYTQVAFLPSDFDYDPKKGYNKGMVNTLRSLKIGGFTASAPFGVKEIDIIYKESSNNNLYIVQSIKKSDPEYTAGTNGEIEITSDVIFKVLPAIQSLRPYDNVPRLAKAQAMSANRIMYGNYLENFDIKDASNNDISVKFNVNITQNTNVPVQIREPQRSLKSIRTYQIGVVYRDKYGRETPVFTDPTGSVTLGKEASIQHNVIQVSIISPLPYWAESYKYFVKESSDEYYNVAMDRWYQAEDGNVWISFPSAERNKLTEETFLILKKTHDDDLFVEDEARYKIIAIENEAPIFLKEDKVSKGILSAVNTDTTGENIFRDLDGFPKDDGGHVNVNRVKWEKVFGGADPSNRHGNMFQVPVHSLSDLVLRFLGNGGVSKYYNIANIQYFDDGTSNNRFYRVEIEERFEEDDIRFTRHSDATEFDAANDSISMEIAQKQMKVKPEFSGRFFTKIERDGVLEQAILRNENPDDYKIASTLPTYDMRTNQNSSKSWWQDSNKGSYPHSQGISARSAEWHIADWGVMYRYRDGGGTYDTSLTGGGKYKGRHATANAARQAGGLGAVAGNNFIEIAYHWWGGKDRSARWGHWNNFERDYRPQFKKAISLMEMKNSKFRFADDPDQTVYTIKAYRRNYYVPYNRGRRMYAGKYGSERLIGFSLELDKQLLWVPGDNNHNSKATATSIEFLDPYMDGDGFTSNNPAIFETEPKEVVDLNLFYEASQAYNKSTHGSQVTLNYSNCFSFGNGVESNRIRDDFNAPTIPKGIKANTVLDTPYAEERKTNQVIFSGLYNSISGTNNTNQFIQADQITKSLNPVYGSIQLMRHRHGGLDVLCEDKCFKLPTNKDILFTADGSKQVTVSSNVLGTATPYSGEFGISKNPESYAQYGYRAYFTDKARGVVLRLSADGLEPISRYGMSDYFKDNLAIATTAIGSYDTNKKSYNLTLNFDTASFKETTNAWSSRKSFLQEAGVSLNNLYYSFKFGEPWVHDNEIRNNFYGVQYNSSIKFIFNEVSGSVKQFKTLNYEGSDSRIFIDSGSDSDNVFENRVARAGWWSNTITSDKQEGNVVSFKEKEGKWFEYIQGTQTTAENIDTSEFSVQGLGGGTVTASNDYTNKVTITINENND